MATISEKIRDALNRQLAAGAVLREIARQVEIDHAQLWRFSRAAEVGGKLHQDAIDRLANYLGLELRPKRRR